MLLDVVLAVLRGITRLFSIDICSNCIIRPGRIKLLELNKRSIKPKLGK